MTNATFNPDSEDLGRLDVMAELLAELASTRSKARRKAIHEEIRALQHADCTMPCGPDCPAF
jgi:hypothetical protein